MAVASRQTGREDAVPAGFERELRRAVSFSAAAARTFLFWWLHELAALVPAGLRRILRARPPCLTLLLDDRKAILALHARGRTEALGEIRLDDDMSPDTVRDLVRLPRRSRGIFRSAVQRVLLLPPQSCFRTAFALPDAALPDLREAVSYAINRETPFKADATYFLCTVAGRDPRKSSLVVEATIALRRVTDAAIDEARKLGFQPDIVAALRDPRQPDAYDVLHQVIAPSRRRHRLSWSLGTLAFLLAAAAFYLPILHTKQLAAAYSERLQALAPPAAEATRLQEEIVRLTDARGFLAKRKRQTFAATELVAELTRLLPDDTWLIELQLSGTELSVQGFSAAAPRVIEILGGSPLLKNVSFRSPVTQDLAAGRERFHITGRIEPGDGK